MTEKFTQFDYLINAMTEAGRQDKPAEHGYADKRRALYAYVRDLEARALLSCSPQAVQEPASVRMLNEDEVTDIFRAVMKDADWGMLPQDLEIAADVQRAFAAANNLTVKD